MRILFTLILYAGSNLILPSSPSSRPLEILEKMIGRCRDIRTLEYVGIQRERMAGKMVGNRALYRVAREPLRIYFREYSPREGLEILYHEGRRRNKLLIHPNQFPWFNLRLSPSHRQVRKHSHHLLTDAGYDYLISVLDHMIQKYPRRIHEMLSFLPEPESEEDTGKIRIQLDNPFFAYIPLRITRQRSLTRIAARRKISDYMILEKNPDIRYYDDLSPGQVIQVPNDYCRRMVITLDSRRSIPLRILLYDDRGIFEDYRFTRVVINPAFSSREFEPDNPGYNF